MPGRSRSTRGTGCGIRSGCGWSPRASRPAASSGRPGPEPGPAAPGETGHVAPTVIVLSRRLGAVLPAAALPALRAASAVYADPSVPEEVARAAGAEPVGEDVGELPAGAVLLTCEPTAEAVAVPEPQGAALLDAVAVMDRLRSPGGCPWDAE